MNRKVLQYDLEGFPLHTRLRTCLSSDNNSLVILAECNQPIIARIKLAMSLQGPEISTRNQFVTCTLQNSGGNNTSTVCVHEFFVL